MSDDEELVVWCRADLSPFGKGQVGGYHLTITYDDDHALSLGRDELLAYRGVRLATPPDPLPVVVRAIAVDPGAEHAMLVGAVDELVIDGDPQVLRAGGYLTNPDELTLTLIRDKLVHVGFDLAEVVGLGRMVAAATLRLITLTPRHPDDQLGMWRPETFTPTFDLLDDEQAPHVERDH